MRNHSNLFCHFFGVLCGLLCLSSTSSLQAQVEFLEESTITNEGLYFWYADGSKAYHYNPNISPRGDCMTVVDGYIFFGWYKGGMTNRALMISRKKIGSGNWVTVQLPHKNTLIQPGNRWGDSHKTISVAVSKIDGTVHIFYDHHNDPLKYIVSKKNKAFAPDSEFTLDAFEPTRGYLVAGQPVTITYPKVTTNANGEIILNYRKGSAVGGNEMVHVYNGSVWTSNRQVTRGVGLPDVAEAERNYAYGVPYFNNGNVYYAWSVRWAAKKDLGILNEGVYLAKCGPTMTSPWEDPNGVQHTLPIQDYSPFLIDLPASNAGKGSSGGPGLVVSEDGDVHVTFDGRGSGSTYEYTYTRRAGESAFTKHTGTRKTGLSWNNRFYTISASGSFIRITSGEPGSLNYVTELVHNTSRSFGVSASYIDEGKLVLIVSENRQSDRKAIYSYVFQLPTENVGPSSGLVAHWPLDEGSGTEVANVAGTPFTAEIENGATWGSDAARASFVDFDGVDDRIATTFTYALKDTDDFTWAWWAKKATSAGIDDGAVMVGNRYGNTGSEFYEFIKFGPSGAQFANTDLVGEISTINYNDLPQNEWHHYAMVKSGTSYQWYVDGEAEGAPVTVDYAETKAIPFLIGGDGDNKPNEHFEGSIDDVVLYRTALTAYNVSSVMNGDYDLTIPMVALGTPVDTTSGSTWLDGLPAHGGAIYLIPATGNLRSVNGNWTFPGDALTIQPGGKFQVRAIESLNQITTVGLINLNGGTSFTPGDFAEITAGTGNGVTNVLDGVIVNTGYSRFVSYGDTVARNLKVQSLIHGSGQIRIIESITSGVSSTTITNESNTFSGKWEVSPQSRLVFENAGAVGESSIDVTSGGRLQILGNWATDGSLSVSDASGTEIALGHFAWSVSGLTVGDAFITDGVYTAAELNALSANPVFTGSGTLSVGEADPDGPIAHWKLDEADGTVAIDSSGNGSRGTLLHGVSWDSDATRGSFASFDGIDDRISTTFTYSLDTDSDFTWAWWAKRSAAVNQQAVMVGNRYPVGASPDIYQFIKFTPNEATFAHTGEIADFHKYNYTNLSVGAWNHYAMVKSGNSYQWYVDGIPQGTPISLAYSGTVPLPFNIGGDDNDTTPGGKEAEHFRGSIDDVVLFDRALTQAELLEVADIGEPEIEVEHNGESLSDGAATIEFPGLVTAGPGSTSATLTVRNTGARPLTGLAATIEGTHASDFATDAFSQSTLVPGQSLNFVLTFASTVVGAKSAMLRIASDDPDENPFDIALSGSLQRSAPMDEWTWSLGLLGNEALPEADRDGDQVSLLEEYAYNLNPLAFDQHVLTPGTGESGLPLIRLVGDRLQVEYLRRRNDPGLVYVVEFGSELPAGFEAATETEAVTQVNADFDRVIINDSATTANYTARFGRVVIQRSNP
jgi:hypothetical protein